MMMGKLTSLSWVAEKADRGAAKATAHRAATGMASTPHHDGTPPSSAATAMNGTAIIAAQVALQIR